MKKQNIILLFAVVLLAVIPMFLIQPPADGSEIFAGADAQAETMITVIHPDYQPWFSPIWEPPSGEIESLLFALQAAIGACMIGYTIGFFRGKRKTGLVE